MWMWLRRFILRRQQRILLRRQQQWIAKRVQLEQLKAKDDSAEAIRNDWE